MLPTSVKIRALARRRAKRLLSRPALRAERDRGEHSGSQALAGDPAPSERPAPAKVCFRRRISLGVNCECMLWHGFDSLCTGSLNRQWVELIATTKPYSVLDAGRGERRFFSLLTLLPSLLAFGRSGLFGPPLCGGSAPATPPPVRAVASVWQYEVVVSRRPGFTPHPASWRVPSMCQRRQDRRGNSHMCPTFTAMTIASPLQKYLRYIPPRQTAHSTHRTWLSSYS